MTPAHAPLGLYVHLPFCRAKCTYCAFAISTDHGLEGQYAEALLTELDIRRIEVPAVDTVFFGGGTPSLFRAERLRQVIERIRQLYSISSGAEISLEANPEDVSAEAIAGWISLGINRLSIGVQSLSDEELYPLGRGHARSSAIAALAAASRSGLRVSADLILGLPGQDERSFRESLGTVLKTGLGHVSLYILDLEPGSALERHVSSGRTRLPEDELTAALYHAAVEMTRSAGLEQYEVSNFARPGEESVHNLRYWNRLPYLGIGLGAHSFVGSRREANTREIGEYISKLRSGQTAIVSSETLSDENQRHEELFLGLRQAAGLRYADLVRLCGTEGERWISRGVEEGWLRRSGERVALTPEGFLVSNELISQLF